MQSLRNMEYKCGDDFKSYDEKLMEALEHLYIARSYKTQSIFNRSTSSLSNSFDETETSFSSAIGISSTFERCQSVPKESFSFSAKNSPFASLRKSFSHSMKAIPSETSSGFCTSKFDSYLSEKESSYDDCSKLGKPTLEDNTKSCNEMLEKRGYSPSIKKICQKKAFEGRGNSGGTLGEENTKATNSQLSMNNNSPFKNSWASKKKNLQPLTSTSRLQESHSNNREPLGDNDTRSSQKEKQIICMYKETSDLYWVLNKSDLLTYDSIQRELNTNINNFSVVSPVIGNVYACDYEGEWYRGKVISLSPLKVHFVDFGNVNECKNPNLRKLSSSLLGIPELAYAVKFDVERAEEFKEDNLETQIISIRITKTSSDGLNTAVITDGKYAKMGSSERKSLDLNSRSNSLSTNSPESTNSDSYVEFKYDEITESSRGLIYLLPGHGLKRVGVVVPDTDDNTDELFEKLIKKDAGNLKSIEAKEGDKVLVIDSEGIDRCGEIISKAKNIYEVRLKMNHVIVKTKNVFPWLYKGEKSIDPGIMIDILDDLDENELDTKFAFEIKSKNEDNWLCDIISLRKNYCIGNAILRKPSEELVGIIASFFLLNDSSVTLSAFGSRHEFYLRKFGEKIKKLYNNMSNKLQKFASNAPDADTPELNKLYAGRCNSDNSFYRVKVVSLEKNLVEVSLVDFGKMETISYQDLKPLAPKLKAIPYFATDVSLIQASTEPYSRKIIEYLEKLVTDNRELIISYQSYLEEVILTDKESDIRINDVIETSKSESEEFNHLNNEIITEESLNYTEISRGTNCNLAVLHIRESDFETEYTFWGTDALSENFMHVNSTLTGMITKYCTEVDSPYEPSDGEVCLANFEGEWYRAMTLEANEEDFTVFFLDFGNISNIKPSCIRKMKPEFIKAPVLATCCIIDGFERLKSKPQLKKKIFQFLLSKVNGFISDVQIVRLESDKVFVKIPEVENMLED